MAKLRDDIEANAEKLLGFARDSDARAFSLRKDVANTSSESSRIAQTMSYLAGKTAGKAADASIRHRENVKESMAEDEEQNARLNRARIKALRGGK